MEKKPLLTPSETDKPLDQNTFIMLTNYADKKQDSRFDELLKSVDTIVFWIRIIGLYYLIKIILTVISLLIAGEGIATLIEKLI